MTENLSNKPAIILVDDELGVLKAVTMILRAFGYQVTDFSDPIAALDFLKSGEKCDLVITDLRMPNIDGVQLVIQAKALNKTRPCIMVSGHASQEEVEAAQKAGIDGFLAKPFNPLELKSLIEKVTAS